MIFKLAWFLTHKNNKPRRWFRQYLRMKSRIVLRPFDRQLLGKHHLVGAEIGVFTGEHALALLSHQKISWLYLVDQYRGYADYNQKEMDQACRDMQPRLCNYIFKTLLKMPSNEAVATMPQLDFVYIDASHDYDSVKEDIRLWWTKIKPGGILGGHDFDFIHPGVIKAVIEFAVHNNLKLETLDPDWWIVKP